MIQAGTDGMLWLDREGQRGRCGQTGRERGDVVVGQGGT